MSAQPTPTEPRTPSRREYAEALRLLAVTLEKDTSLSSQLVAGQLVVPANTLVQLLVYWGYRFIAERKIWEPPPPATHITMHKS
jgi:hypothetical protein